MNSILVGFGNTILRDDGVGVRLGETIADDLELKFCRCSMYGFEILEKLADYDRAFIVDALRTENGQVGDVHYFTLDDFQGCRHLSSPHTTNFAGGLEFAREVGLDVPGEVFIYGVEVESTEEFGETLTEQLAESYESIKTEIREDMKTQLNQPTKGRDQ